MKLSRGEVRLLMRSLLRSLERTPERERAAHKALYDRASAESVRMTPRKRLRAVARAMDHAVGEWGR